MDLEKTRKELQKIEREIHSEIFRLSGIEDNWDYSLEAMTQLCKMQSSIYPMLNLIEIMRCNEVENE